MFFCLYFVLIFVFVSKAKPRNQDFCSFLKKSKIKKNEKENTSSSSSPSSDATQSEQLAQLLNSENFSLTVFHLDLIKKKANILRVGNDLKNLKIYSTFSSNNHGFNPTTTAAPLTSSNSSSNLSIHDSYCGCLCFLLFFFC